MKYILTTLIGSFLVLKFEILLIFSLPVSFKFVSGFDISIWQSVKIVGLSYISVGLTIGLFALMWGFIFPRSAFDQRLRKKSSKV